jgi:nucleotide-binding universal stress UspA family protein
LETDTTMTESQTAPHVATFVVAVDFGDASKLALEAALIRASERGRSGINVEVHVLNVIALAAVSTMGIVALPPAALEDPTPALRTFVDAAWAKCATEHASGAALPIQIVLHSAYGDAASQIVELAARVRAEAVYVGTHGRTGITRLFLGSVAESVVRASPTSVIVSRISTPLDVPPSIEPLCADCATARGASAGATLWCARHAAHHPRPHGYSYAGASYSEMRPWGFSGAG